MGIGTFFMSMSSSSFSSGRTTIWLNSLLMLKIRNSSTSVMFGFRYWLYVATDAFVR